LWLIMTDTAQYVMRILKENYSGKGM
jgi:hypothetical protein